MASTNHSSIRRLRRVTGFLLVLALALAACGGTAPALPEPTSAARPAAPTVEAAPTETSAPPAVAQATDVQPEVAGSTLSAPSLAPGQETPALNCASPAEPTPAMTEGPYYSADTPERTSLLEPGMPGTRLVITGYVLTVDCQPIPGAWLDFWQADAEGAYDNAGFRLRGHQSSDERGRYTLETVLPGEYPGRTQHIHVKVQAPGGAVLTSQLFFPGASGNTSDRIFSPQLLVEMQETESGIQASFNFILDR